MRPIKFTLAFFALSLTAIPLIEPTIAALVPPAGFEGSMAAPAPPWSPQSSQWPQVPLLEAEQRVFEMVNEERARRELPALVARRPVAVLPSFWTGSQRPDDAGRH